jgi:hydroxylamine reductase
MFCYQCQEAAGCKGCTVRGVCGKTDETANLQDLLIYTLKGISMYALKLNEDEAINNKINKFIIEGLFSTITNANFDKNVFVDKIKSGLVLRNEIKEVLIRNGVSVEELTHDAAVWSADTVEEFNVKATKVGILATENEDVRSLRELLTYGLKGMAAYAEHALNLGYEDKNIYTFIKKSFSCYNAKLISG